MLDLLKCVEPMVLGQPAHPAELVAALVTCLDRSCLESILGDIGSTLLASEHGYLVEARVVSAVRQPALVARVRITVIAKQKRPVWLRLV